MDDKTNLGPCECGGRARYEKRPGVDGHRYWVLCMNCERSTDEQESCELARVAWARLNHKGIYEAFVDFLKAIARALQLTKNKRQ